MLRTRVMDIIFNLLAMHTYNERKHRFRILRFSGVLCLVASREIVLIL